MKTGKPLLPSFLFIVAIFPVCISAIAQQGPITPTMPGGPQKDQSASANVDSLLNLLNQLVNTMMLGQWQFSAEIAQIEEKKTKLQVLTNAIELREAAIKAIEAKIEEREKRGRELLIETLRESPTSRLLLYAWSEEIKGVQKAGIEAIETKIEERDRELLIGALRESLTSRHPLNLEELTVEKIEGAMISGLPLQFPLLKLSIALKMMEEILEPIQREILIQKGAVSLLEKEIQEKTQEVQKEKKEIEALIEALTVTQSRQWRPQAQ
ncbi:MAG: hypothetical protein HYZ50_25810 [Deltaproteobacteria bacterium]|nr:hypothetical protein [Deltaproteobacteria bacterium]